MNIPTGRSGQVELAACHFHLAIVFGEQANQSIFMKYLFRVFSRGMYLIFNHFNQKYAFYIIGYLRHITYLTNVIR